jgi:hypothetical protein
MKAKVVVYKTDGPVEKRRLEFDVIFNGIPMPGQSFYAYKNNITGTIKAVNWMTYGDLNDKAEMDCLIIVE